VKSLSSKGIKKESRVKIKDCIGSHRVVNECTLKEKYSSRSVNEGLVTQVDWRDEAR
jgi:hypothetical protein